MADAYSGQAATISNLITAAARGVADGIDSIKNFNVVLKEFEIEVNYSCTTEFQISADGSATMRFGIIKAKFSASTSYKTTTTYGLKVRFLFVGKSEEEGTSSSSSGTS